MEREDAYQRKLGTVLECLEQIPESPGGLSTLEREGVLHLVQVATDAVMDVAAMLTKDHGRRVRDDYHNLDELTELEIVDPGLADELATLNGLRNAIVHKYNKFEEAEVLENLDQIESQLVRFVQTIDEFLQEDE